VLRPGELPPEGGAGRKGENPQGYLAATGAAKM